MKGGAMGNLIGIVVVVLCVLLMVGYIFTSQSGNVDTINAGTETRVEEYMAQ